MAAQVENALASLGATYPSDEVTTDLGHKSDKNKEPEERKHEEYGVYHFAVWKAQGHRHNAPGLNTKNHSSSEKLTASTVFLKIIAPLIQAIGITFEGVDKPTYTSVLKLEA